MGYAAFAPILGIISFSWTLLIVNSIFAVLFIALAIILGNQEKILKKLDLQGTRQRKLLPAKVCIKCNHTYDVDYKSCPKCGYKENS